MHNDFDSNNLWQTIKDDAPGMALINMPIHHIHREIIIYNTSTSYSSMRTDWAANFPALHESWSRDIQAVRDRSLHHAKAKNIQSEQRGSWWQFLPGHVWAGT